jgi:small subunit ribosomal protein S17
VAERAHRKTRTGRVVSDKAEQTITVAVETRVRHRLYKKTIKQTRKFMADDPKNEAGIGDLVEIMETRPLSKLKRWRLDKIIEKAQ